MRPRHNTVIAEEWQNRILDVLWPLRGTDASRVFAVVDGARNRRIFGLVDAARADKTNLYSVNARWPGEDLPWKLIGASPYLIELDRDDELTAELISSGWEDHWGIFCRSSADLKTMRRHFRELLVVRDERGRKLMFRFYDPRVLRLYLPSCLSDELRAMFGPVDAFILPGQDPQTAIQYRVERNRLARRIFEYHGAERAGAISK